MKNKKDRTINILKSYKEIIAVYLFGSFADGYYRRGSDIDIGVLFSSSLKELETLSLSLEIGEELERKLKEKVDLITMNSAPCDLVVRCIKGTLLLDKNPTERATFEARILSKHYDYKKFLKLHMPYFLERVKEGKIGEIG